MIPFASACQRGALCGVCRGPSSAVHRANWRLKYEGVPDDETACNFDRLTGQPATPEPFSLPQYVEPPSQEEIDRRSKLPCKLRQEDGGCPLCGCAATNKQCSAMAAAGPCPAPEPKW